MLDSLLQAKEIARERSLILEKHRLKEKGFLLATVHRAENTDDPQRLKSIMQALEELSREQPVIFPMHPRTRKALESIGISFPCNSSAADLRSIPPVGYLDMLRLEESAKAILTDSGGIQKEAYFHGVPCVTLRDETEWVETIAHGWNQVAGADTDSIVELARRATKGRPINDFGNGSSASRIARLLSAN